MSSLRLFFGVLALLVFTSTNIVSAQVPPPEVPDFIQNIETAEEFDALSPEQRAQAAEFFAAVGPGFSMLPTQAVPEGVSNCFDHYSFGSVQVNVSPAVGGTVSGVPMTFTGQLENNNSYPIVDGAVYMKVFKLPTDGTLPVQGYDVVDQRFVVEDVSLQGSSTRPVTITWDVPAGLPTGEYQAAFFFTSAKRFNLLGLPFTDDVVGNTLSFTVSGELDDTVSFSKDSVTVDGSDYYFTAFTPKVDAAAPITVTAELVNGTAVPQEVPVTITTYAWDQQREENVIDVSTDTVTVAAAGTAQVTYTVTDVSSSVYLVVMEAKYLDVKSVLNVRFTRSNIPSARINFPAVTNYPLRAGEATTLFSCLHGAGTMPRVGGGKLELTLQKLDGTALHTHTYEGVITGEMMGVADSYTPTEDLDSFILTAALYRNGSLVESVDMVYDCNQLGGCAIIATEETDAGDTAGLIGYLVVAFALLVAVAAIGVFAMQRKQSVGTPLAFLLAVAGATGLLTVGGTAEAASQSVHTTYSYDLYYEPTDVSWAGTYWYKGLGNPNISVSYNAYVYNDDTDELIPPGGTVPVGTRLRFEYGRGGIAWDGTGYTADTPVGVWTTGAARSGSMCIADNLVAEHVANYMGFDGMDNTVYAQLAVHPGNMSFSTVGSTAGLTQNAPNVYTVTSAGTINAQFSYASTYGKFYYGYRATNIHGYDSGCRLSINDYPMGTYEGTASVPGSIAGVDWLGIGPTKYFLPATIPIPAGTYTYSITVPAGISNTPPADPTVVPVEGTPGDTNTHMAGTSQTFTLQATDPDGDTIRYGIDWNMDGTIDQWRPAPTAFVASGVTRNVNRTWVAAGVKTFRVLTEDEHAARSGWTTHSITICGAGYVWNGTSCEAVTYSCTGGPIPANSSVYTGDLTGLSADTPYTYAPADTGAKCEFACDAGYDFIGGSCVLSAPESCAITMRNSVTGVTRTVSVSLPKTVYEVGETIFATGYASANTFDDGFGYHNHITTLQGQAGGAVQLIARAAIGSLPQFPDGTLGSFTGTYGTLLNTPAQTVGLTSFSTPGAQTAVFTGSASWHYSYADLADPVIIRSDTKTCAIPVTVSCPSGTGWNAGTASCEAITYSCTNLPLNATLYPGDEVGLGADTDAVQNSSNSGALCEFDCDAGYAWNGTSCEAVTYSCTGGPLPANSSVYTGDLTGLSADTPYTYAPADTGAKCEFGCDTNYTWISGTQTCEDVRVLNVCNSSLVRADAVTNPLGVLSLDHNTSKQIRFRFDDTPDDCVATEFATPDVLINESDAPNAVSLVDNGNYFTVNGTNPGPGNLTERVRFTHTPSGQILELDFTVSPDPSVLQVCANGALVANSDSTPFFSETIEDEDVRNLSVYFDDSLDCTGTNLALDPGVSYTSGGPQDAFTLTNGATDKILTGDNDTAAAETEQVTISYLGRQVTLEYEVVGLPNLTANINDIAVSSAFDPLTGNYSSISILYNVINNGGSPADESTLRFFIDINDDSNVEYTLDEPIPALAAGGGETGSHSKQLATNVPPGTHSVLVFVDAEHAVTESDEGDNTFPRSISLAYPDPGLELNADPTLVRKEGTAELNWTTGASYPMSCTISGPDISTVNFDPSLPIGAGNITGPLVTGPITNKSEFILQCTAPDGSVFSDSATVQSVGDIEEI